MATIEKPPKPRRASPGSGISWAAARAYYLALPRERRTHLAVAERFGVTRGRVSQVAGRERWTDEVEKLDAAEREAELRGLEKRVRMIARARGERLARTLEVFDRVNDLSLAMIPLTSTGELDLEAIRKGGLPRLDQLLEKIPGLHRMTMLALGEATDRLEIASVQPVLVAFARIAVLHAPAELRGEVMRELEEASAGLISLEGS